MFSLRALLLALLSTVPQFVPPVDAKGGGKGSSSKNSKKTSKSKTKPPEILKEGQKCYNEQHVEIKCPAKKNTALIVGVIIAVIAAILVLALAIWFFKRRSQEKSKKGLDVKSREFDDASSDRESIVPLVYGETKEKDGGYSYKDKSTDV